MNTYEQLGERDLALKWLASAIKSGYSIDAIERSPSLTALRRIHAIGHSGWDRLPLEEPPSWPTEKCVSESDGDYRVHPPLIELDG